MSSRAFNLFLTSSTDLGVMAIERSRLSSDYSLYHTLVFVHSLETVMNGFVRFLPRVERSLYNRLKHGVR